MTDPQPRSEARRREYDRSDALATMPLPPSEPIQALARTLADAMAAGDTTPVRRAALRHVVLPQALRFAIPGVTNDFISLLKDSSLVSMLAVVELTKRMTITAVDNRGWLVPGLLCAALYFLLGYPLARLARRLERRRRVPSTSSS